MTLPLGGMLPQLVNLTDPGWIWTYKIFTCAHQLSPPHGCHPPAHQHQWQLTGETVPFPFNVWLSHETEVGAYDILGTATSATSAAHVTETIWGYAAHFIPLAPIVSLPLPCSGRYWRGPAVYSDSCKQCNIPVCPDQPCGLHCLAPLFCSSSVDSPYMSVPVHSFSSLTLVHLVSPLQFSQFQAEHYFRLGQPRGPSGGRRGLMARLQVGHAFGVFMLPRLGVGSSSLQVPRHPISMCDSHVKPL